MCQMLRLEMLWKADFPKGDFGSFGKDPAHGPSRHQIPAHDQRLLLFIILFCIISRLLEQLLHAFPSI
jgi:hypothetical protein